MPIKEKCVLALGFFDGVHIAHRELIERARAEARSRGLALGIFTFPSEDGLKSGTPRLYGTKEKLGIFERLGVDFTVLADFLSVAHLTPKDFVAGVLTRDLNCALCVAGFNFRFGKAAAGDAGALRELMAECGGEAILCDEMRSGGKTVSASLIRECITNADMSHAQDLLGAPYTIKGRVQHGNAEGRRLGFPTVNTEIDAGRVIPRLGVYRSAVLLPTGIYPAVTNVGKCPTFSERDIHAETYIIGFSGDLYEQDIDIYLLGFLREERRFSSADELKMQINIDKNKAIKENGDLKWLELGLK